jgi:hypothetical protein
MMADSEAKGAEFEKKADKKLSGWAVFGSKYDDAAELLEKAANSYKLAKSWDKAANAYIKLANCQLKLESKHEAASAYVDAANCYKKSQPQGQQSFKFESTLRRILEAFVFLYMVLSRSLYTYPHPLLRSDEVNGKKYWQLVTALHNEGDGLILCG